MLFFGESESVTSIIRDFHRDDAVDADIRKYECRKRRLVWQTLVAYDESCANALMVWLRGNIDKIAEFCFSRGLASNPACWAQYVWYKNELGEDPFDVVISLKAITQNIRNCPPEMICPGTRLGGTTIQLPFGFVQWHQGQMQFHHNLAAIQAWCPSR